MTQIQQEIGTTPETPLDLVVVGGGINGAGVAADAAGRGLKVLLCEQKDFASATSSASSKLIHGGLRYLEHYEFRLVKEALQEREVLLKVAPHLVKPMRFILPHQPHLRPAWMIRTGLFLYDHLGKRETLPGSRGVKFNGSSALDDKIKQGFEYADCWVDDARLVIHNVLAAAEHGAIIKNGTSCISAKRENNLWCIELKDRHQQTQQVFCKGLINATGPWVVDFIKGATHTQSRYGIRLIKGSHIVVPKMYESDEAYILQNEDQRIIFVIPYLDNYSLIGTTDVEYNGNPRDIQISAQEVDYLISITNSHFKRHISPADIIYSYSGVRPLCDDESPNPSAITRDYTITVDDEDGKAPLLNIFGGKLTTYRKLANAAMENLRPYFPTMSEGWTAFTPMPGGQFTDGFEQFCETMYATYPWLEKSIVTRYCTNYGTRATILLNNVKQVEELGPYFGAGLYGKEVDYLITHEWANSLEDIIWRRTKAGIELTHNQLNYLRYYLEKNHDIAC
ncbi:glycerol-3-phosphate dehydrogenase [Zooshikella ganghwensis]|uniref:Glycerol-3-phosphate dehydrogenase n=1 Tax=Zooshikella ganghwensis TaxID=202772 RepID=A0A4V1INW8_9GAMM|nr:glycerol-3-phosphate dehydrogenase [Zooshikella ganghwensis]RDH45181.1 glycerol-3-phosphate dehydrogenase [Zooshikella ganghwensis]